MTIYNLQKSIKFGGTAAPVCRFPLSSVSDYMQQTTCLPCILQFVKVDNFSLLHHM